MVNAWSLLYDQINGTLDEEYPVMTGISTDTTIFGGGGDDTISFQGAADWNYNDAYWDDTVTFSSDGVGAADTINIGSPIFGSASPDTISFTGYGNTAYDDPTYYSYGKPQPNFNYQRQKYGEDKGIKDLEDYVSSTYQGHYTNENSDVQTLDLIHSVGDAESFCRSNALKYLSRYDKKGSAKRDILKAMHYCLLLYYFSGQTNETPTRGYETF